MKKITIKYENCTGCKLCEEACSLYRYGKISHNLSRIRVKSLYPGFDIPVQCVQCDNAPCIDVCPVNAIYKKDGIVKIKEEECIQCGNCVKACPAGAIWINQELGYAIKCDLCDGREGGPACVEICPNDALTYHTVPFDTRVYAKKAENILKELNRKVIGEEGNKCMDTLAIY